MCKFASFLYVGLSVFRRANILPPPPHTKTDPTALSKGGIYMSNEQSSYIREVRIVACLLE